MLKHVASVLLRHLLLLCVPWELENKVSVVVSTCSWLDDPGTWHCLVIIAESLSPRAVVYHTLTRLADRSSLYLMVTINSLSVTTVGQETDQKCTK